MAKNLIELKHLEKSFGDTQVIKDISLDIREGEFLTLLGPSGCGKTTILRMIGGFETPTAGEILLDGKDLVPIPANKRQINTVFQSYALFPHLTVRENIGYGMRMKKVPKDEIKQRVDEMLEMIQLEPLANRKPRQLSGGQQQRVAIARSLVNKPRLLLLDEPLGALDLHLRKEMQLELKRLQQKLGITYIYVTHDQEEAMTMSDRIVVMNKGKIEQIGTAKEIYSKPASEFVSQFLGESNLFEGKYEESNNSGKFTIDGVTFEIPLQEEKPTSICVRPEQIKVLENAGLGLPGTITESIFMGQIYRIAIRLDSGKVCYSLSKDGYDVGAKVGVSFDPEKVSGISC